MDVEVVSIILATVKNARMLLEHESTNISLKYWCYFHWLCAQKWAQFLYKFQFLRELHNIFPNEYNPLSFHQQCIRVSLMFLPIFIFHLLIIVILTGLRWYLFVVLIWISLMISNEQIFMFFLVSVWLLWKNSCFGSLYIFKSSQYVLFFPSEWYTFPIYFAYLSFTK